MARRCQGAPREEPFRLRVVRRETFGRRGTQGRCDSRSAHPYRRWTSPPTSAQLLSSGATFDGEPVEARDVAVIVENRGTPAPASGALGDAGIPAVYSGDADVFDSEAADDWLCLLEAIDQPHRAGMVRAAAATMFFGETAENLVDGGDALTDRIAETLRDWAGHARERGVAAIFEAAQLGGMGGRVLSWRGGERQMTDLAHMTQLLQEAAHREHFRLPALRDWLRAQREERSGATERNRRLDSDAAAVQIMTEWVGKGLQFPIVYLPFTFNRNMQGRDRVLYHDTPPPLPARRQARTAPTSGRSEAGPGRGRRRRQPADLRGADPRAVSGGGVVVAVVRRAERRAVAAAAGPPAWRIHGARSLRARQDQR